MINYKSFSLPGNAKLRVRADKIVATKSSKSSSSIELYIEGIATPMHVPLGDSAPSKLIDYIWERHNTEEGEEDRDV